MWIIYYVPTNFRSMFFLFSSVYTLCSSRFVSFYFNHLFFVVPEHFKLCEFRLLPFITQFPPPRSTAQQKCCLSLLCHKKKVLAFSCVQHMKQTFFFPLSFKATNYKQFIKSFLNRSSQVFQFLCPRMLSSCKYLLFWNRFLLDRCS